MARHLAMVCMLVLGCVGPSSVERPQVRLSPLGYAAVVPPGWIVVGKNELAGREAELESEIARTLGDAPAAAAVLPRIVEATRSGSIEYLLPEAKDADSYDNINIQVNPGQVPPIGTDVSPWCDPLAQMMSKSFDRPIEVFVCDLRVVAGEPALYLESDGFYEDSRILLYMLDHSPGKMLTVTATLRADSVESYRPAVEAFVESIAFPDR